MKNALGIQENLKLTAFFALAVSISVFGQDSSLLTLRGKVYDEQSNEPLPLASIRLKELRILQ